MQQWLSTGFNVSHHRIIYFYDKKAIYNIESFHDYGLSLPKWNTFPTLPIDTMWLQWLDILQSLTSKFLETKFFWKPWHKFYFNKRMPARHTLSLWHWLSAHRSWHAIHFFSIVLRNGRVLILSYKLSFTYCRNKRAALSNCWNKFTRLKRCMPPDEPKYYKKITLEKNVLKL
jgi:hypothetical protein